MRAENLQELIRIRLFSPLPSAWQTASERWSTTRNSSPTGRAAVWLSWSVRTIARVTSTWGWYSGSSSLPQCRRGRSLRTQTEGSDGSRKKPVGPALTCDRREHDLCFPSTRRDTVTQGLETCREVSGFEAIEHSARLIGRRGGGPVRVDRRHELHDGRPHSGCLGFGQVFVVFSQGEEDLHLLSHVDLGGTLVG